jgi:hypothetical protein
MRAAEGGPEVVQRNVVRQIDESHLSAPPTFVAVEEIVIPYGEVE